MRFNILSAVFLVGSVIAVPPELVARDISVVDNAMKRVSGALQDIDRALQAITPYRDAREADAQTTWILKYSRVLIDELQAGSRDIKRGPTVNTMEALSLPQKTDTMFKQLQNVIAGIKKLKPAVVVGGRQRAVYTELRYGSDAMAGFFDAVVTKLGPVEAALTMATKSQFLSAFEAIVREFSI
jgi:hypothetical protein